MQRPVVVLTLVLVALSVPHAIEDFRYGQFSLPAVAGAALALMYGAQAAGIYLVARGFHAGSTLLGAAALVWCVGAITVHGPAIIASAPYRSGLPSRMLEVAVICAAAATAGLGLWPSHKSRL
jgi:hypothetical protein